MPNSNMNAPEDTSNITKPQTFGEYNLQRAVKGGTLYLTLIPKAYRDASQVIDFLTKNLQIKQLAVWKTSIEDSFLEKIVTSTAANNITSVKIDTVLTSGNLELFAKLPNVRSLVIEEVNFEDVKLYYPNILEIFPKFLRLESLNLSKTTVITKKDAIKLKITMPSLKSMSLDGNNFTEEDLTSIQEDTPEFLSWVEATLRTEGLKFILKQSPDFLSQVDKALKTGGLEILASTFPQSLLDINSTFAASNYNFSSIIQSLSNDSSQKAVDPDSAAHSLEDPNQANNGEDFPTISNIVNIPGDLGEGKLIPDVLGNLVAFPGDSE